MRDGKYKYVRYLCADYIEELMISKRTRWS